MNQNETTIRLSTLKEHQNALKDALTSAKKRVVVVSPFISISAINSDNIVQLTKSAVARGVDVHFYIDYHLNCVDGEMKLSARDGISALAKVGGKVGIVDGIHNKTLIKDNDLIAEGSFNWLSAVRIRSGECQREERTLVYSGEGAEKMIAQEIERISRSDYAYATAKAEKVPHPFTSTVKTMSVIATVLLAILFFISGNVKWVTFGVFAIGLLPFAISAIRKDLNKKNSVGFVDQAGKRIPGGSDETSGTSNYTDPNNSKKYYGYMPGVREFDGTYKVDC